MNTSKILIIAGNLVLALGLIVLLGLGRITWEQFGAGLALLAFPSVASVLRSDEPPKPSTKSPPPTLMTLILLCAVVSCSPTESARAKNAVDLAGYTKALDDCRGEGKAAGSYAVYEACAKAADRRFGRDGGAQ